MKKSFAKVASLVLIAVLAFTLAACGKNETPADEAKPAAAEETAKEEPATKEEAVAEEPAKEEPEAPASITGTYKGKIDYTDQVSQQFSETLGFELEEPLYMDIYLYLNEDDTFQLSVDAEKYKADIIAVLSSHIDDIIAKSLEQNGLSEDQLGEVAEANGYDDVDSFKKAMVGMLEAELEETINLEEYEDDLNISGSYTVSGDKIYLVNEDGTDTITINDDGTLSVIIPLEGTDTEVVMTKQE